MISLEGRAKYIHLETGFWGIIGKNGKEYLPVNMPEQLKLNGATVKCTAEVLNDFDTIYQWGIPIRIISFHTISP
ncbi:MAG: hypothetical protein R3250_06245 [Melioribacteraceae bacterium]|nr:hypothetical protein [Melioribacteraceae bacterium]